MGRSYLTSRGLAKYKRLTGLDIDHASCRGGEGHKFYFYLTDGRVVEYYKGVVTDKGEKWTKWENRPRTITDITD